MEYIFRILVSFILDKLWIYLISFGGIRKIVDSTVSFGKADTNHPNRLVAIT